MKVLVDEHHAPAVAEQLRERGHDVVAVPEDAGLRGLTDSDLFAEAQRRERAILTENVSDYLALDAEYRNRQVGHWGLILTSNRTFPRGKPQTVGALVRALDELLRSRTASEASSSVIWLQRPT